MHGGSIRDSAGKEFVRRFEKIFGPIVFAHLQSTMQYTYFGTSDIASIIETKPDLFERAMSEIFGKAWPTILSMTTVDNPAQRSGEDEMKVGKSRYWSLENSGLK